jgi:hypothetical protein
MGKTIRLLVSGGREYGDKKEVCRVLNTYLKRVDNNRNNLLVIQGGATGADGMAERWALENGVPCITMKAPWPFYDKASGPIRNGWMIKFAEPTHVYLFPGGKGTNDMRKKAIRAGLIVRPKDWKQST